MIMNICKDDDHHDVHNNDYVYDLVDHGDHGDHDHDNHDNDRPGGAHQPDRDE